MDPIDTYSAERLARLPDDDVVSLLQAGAPGDASRLLRKLTPTVEVAATPRWPSPSLP